GAAEVVEGGFRAASLHPEGRARPEGDRGGSRPPRRRRTFSRVDYRGRESSMSNLQPGQQLVRTRTTAGGGADSETRRASRRDAGDHGLTPIKSTTRGHRD